MKNLFDIKVDLSSYNICICSRHICFYIKYISVHPLLWMNVMLDFMCMVYAELFKTGSKRTIQNKNVFLRRESNQRPLAFHRVPLTTRLSGLLTTLLVLFLIIFFLSYFSLQQIFSNYFSVISQPILIKFDTFVVIVCDNFMWIRLGVGTWCCPKVYYAL